MSRCKKEIKAVIVPPKSERAKQAFQKKMCDFYAAQVEHRLRALPKEKKLEVLEIMLASFQ